MSETVNILAINGPNLNMLGTREPEIYGAETLADVEASCRAVCEGENVSLEWMQTNSEAQARVLPSSFDDLGGGRRRRAWFWCHVLCHGGQGSD